MLDSAEKVNGILTHYPAPGVYFQMTDPAGDVYSENKN
jgi:hypothetical protein